MIGKCRNRRPPDGPLGQRRLRSRSVEAPLLECIEGPQSFGNGQVDGDDEDRHQRRPRRRQWLARPLLHIDHDLPYMVPELPMMPGICVPSVRRR